MSKTEYAMPVEYAQLEIEFQNRLHVFCDEVEAANQYFFAFMTLHSEYAQRKEVRALFDNHSLVTKTLLSGLQAALFLALGRIFDETSKHTIYTLLKFATKHPQLFSPESLRARKERAAANWAEWLDEYMEGTHQPTAADFRALKKAVKTHFDVYMQRMDSIRNKWFAHRESEREEANQLFALTSIDEFERVLGFLIAFHDALYRTYHDGEPLAITDDLVSPSQGRQHPWAPLGVFTVQKWITKETKQFLDKASSIYRAEDQ